MHKSNEDCFYFLTSLCAKGSSCTYRHSPLALTCNVICPAWLRGNCLDPACPFRHTTAQRPLISNGILCFYENTPTGCLKVDCTFIHSRPRVTSRTAATIRPSSTNLIKKDATKPIVSSVLPTVIPQTTPTSNTSINPLESTPSEPQIVIPITKIESLSNSEISSPITTTETTARRIALSSDIDQSNESKTILDNNSTSPKLHKSSSRSVITDTPKIGPDETTTTTQSRLVVSRNVVLSESTGIPNRKIVQTTTTTSSSSPSNRVVVSSDCAGSTAKDKRTDVDSVEQKHDSKKFKQDSSSSVNIPFPCSTPSITNRLSFNSSKETTSTNDAKPIRLNRDRLPATKISNGNSPVSVTTSSHEEKSSAGTVLLQDNERRTMRIERFQKKPNSPSRSIVCSASITTVNNMTIHSSTNRNVITSTTNDRKRTIPETTIADEPPPKRISSSLSHNKSSPRQPATSLNSTIQSTLSSSSREKKSTQSKNSATTTNGTHHHAISSPVRSHVTSPSIVSPALQQSSLTTTTTTTIIKTSRIRQPPSVAIKRPLTPMVTSAQTLTKAIEQIPINITENKTLTSKRTAEPQTPNQDDENQLLKLNESSDVVDTFAFIDEALLETDNLLELF
ncbi:unnamed protein product [Rotaria magnacalcarata]|uniref:C3H1-type domain-containing protein n=2 Tax=Rotaria magnacalcarata TaxID=392030 RepID=A0A816H8N7_9BILA|nr:unnamed protein product [Rotaria magnacalcarata]CAF1682855.1 unnamed protein product [Rotaria magnacalcarata]CAF3762604.1 unnamed protein product [Rotaria magnacalcarata]CAF3794070.1 unnamed protein product [Rotaria magnacalcarata]